MRPDLQVEEDLPKEHSSVEPAPEAGAVKRTDRCNAYCHQVEGYSEDEEFYDDSDDESHCLDRDPAFLPAQESQGSLLSLMW